MPKANLDLLRAVAVAMVVADHTLLAFGVVHVGAWVAEWIGVVGVYMFFVHTSLVLMWSLERKPYTLDFYIRRVFRIYPLAMLAVLVAIVTHAPVNGTVGNYFSYQQVTATNAISALLLVQNLVQGQSNLISVLWTLPLEVQMYVFLPFLFFFAQREKVIWPLLLVWALVCAVCHLLFSDVNSTLPMVIPLFLPGVMAYVGFSRWRPRLPAWVFPLLLAGLIALFMVHPNSRRAWAFCLALGLALPLFQQFRAPWITRPSHELAKYSYGIYLAHPFAIVLGPYLLARHSLWLQLAVEFTTIVILAVCAYHVIEYPFIRLGSRLAAKAEFLYEREEAATDR